MDEHLGDQMLRIFANPSLSERIAALIGLIGTQMAVAYAEEPEKRAQQSIASVSQELTAQAESMRRQFKRELAARQARTNMRRVNAK